MTGYISKYCGFCFGVSLAVKTAYEESQSENFYMYGEVVHNPTVIKKLKERNVKIINDVKEIKTTFQPKVLLRAHGLPKSTVKLLKNFNCIIIDRTCPKVKRIHNIVSKSYSENKKIIIIGNLHHPETVGINGWCNYSAYIIENIEQARKIIPNLNPKDVFCIVSQTTFDQEEYFEIYRFIKQYLENIEFYNTICNDTANRQKEVINLSSKVDMIIIVGGKNSSNSTKLFQIAKKICDNAQHIESKYELDLSNFHSISTFAICSGASTPMESVEEIIEYIKKYNLKNNIQTSILKLN